MNKTNYFRSLFFLVVGLQFPILAKAQFFSQGARGVSLGEATVALNDIHSVWSNQAGLAFLEKPSFNLFAQQHYLIPGLKTLGAAALYPTFSGNFGVALNYLGFEKYNEQRIGLNYSRQLMDKLSIGGQFTMLNAQIPEYGNKALFTFEIGLLADFIPNVKLGFHIANPVRMDWLEGEKLPSRMKLGFAYRPSDILLLLGEVEKDVEYPARVKAGIEYQPVNRFSVRTGISTQPTSLYFGVGYGLENGLSFDIAASYHQILGTTPVAGITYQFK